MENANGPLKIGIVGLQDQGMVFGRKLSELNQSLVGVDVNPEARATFGERYGADTYENLEQIFDLDIEAVVVTTPNKYHVQPTIAALRNGYDVFVENPLAENMEGARRIAEVEREVDQFCMVGFHFRFLSICESLKEYIDDGYFGDVYHIEARNIRRRGIPGRGSWYTSKEIAGGGAIIDIGIHSIDLLHYFLDSPEIEEVMNVTRTKFGHKEDYQYLHMHGKEGKPHRFDVEDSGTILLEMENGQTANIEVAWASNNESTHEYYIHGTDAGAHLDLTNASFSSTGHLDQERDNSGELRIFEARGDKSDHFFDGTVKTSFRDPYTAQFEAFIQSVEAGERQAGNSVEDALEVQRVIEDIYR